MIEASEAILERLNDAHQSFLRVDWDADPRAYIRASNVLLDACFDAGMPHDAEHHDWAAERVTRWLCAM